VRLARLKRHAQRHTLAQQVLLTDDFAQSTRAQPFCEWDVGSAQGISLFKCAGSVATWNPSLSPARRTTTVELIIN
jgi:hypothetical protein